MIDIAHLKDNLDQYKKKLKSKGYVGNLDEILSKNEAKNNTETYRNYSEFGAENPPKMDQNPSHMNPNSSPEASWSPKCLILSQN